MNAEANNVKPTNLDDGPVRLREFAKGCSQYRLMIGLIMVVCVCLALAIAVFSTRIYEARVLMAPVKEDAQQSRLAGLASQFGGFAAQLGIGAGSANITEEAIATLKSRAFIEQFVAENNLVPVLFDDIWNPDTGEWDVEEADEIPSIEDAYIRFDQIMNVSQNLQTGLVQLSIEWKERELIPIWANELVEQVNTRMRRRAIAEADRGLTYLNEQLEQTSVVELRSAIFRLIESNVQTIMLANARKEYAFRVIDPAAVSEPGRFVRPKKLLILVVGFIFGVLLSCSVVLLRLLLRRI